MNYERNVVQSHYTLYLILCGGKGFLVSSFDTSSVVKVLYKIYLPFSPAISALFFVTLLVFVNICFSLPSVLRSARVVGWGVVTEI